MASSLDIRTLFIFYAFFNACLFLFLFFIGKKKNVKHSYFLRIYITGKALQTITWLLFGLRGELVSVPFSVIVANPLFIFGTAYDIFPFIWFQKENYTKYFKRTNLLLLVFSVIFISVNQTDHGVRSAVMSLILFLIFGSAGIIIFINKSSTKTQKIAAALAMITAIAMISRSYLAGFQNVSNNLFSETPIYVISYVLAFIVPFYLTVLFVMLLNEDNENEIIQQQNIIALDNIKLSNLNKTKDKIFSIIGHDLKGPIGGIVQLGQMLSGNLGKLTNKEKDEVIESITQTAVSTKDTLHNLLQWARSESGTLNIEKKSISVYEIVEESKKLLIESIKEKNIHFENLVEISSHAIADYNMTFTILRNLIANAIKFTPNGGNVSVYSDIFGAMLKISVKDNGVGIPKEIINKLFDPDFQYYTSGTNNEPGTGIGLTLCYEFVIKNGGTMNVVSEENKGSIFHFTLPLAID